MRKKIILFLWIAGIVFPMAWLGWFSRGFLEVFDKIFGPLWMHVLMHAGLFAVLALLLSVILAKTPAGGNRKRFLLVLGAVLGVGLLQEVVQAFSQGAFSLGGAAFDLGIDLAGGLLGYGLEEIKSNAYWASW